MATLKHRLTAFLPPFRRWTEDTSGKDLFFLVCREANFFESIPLTVSFFGFPPFAPFRLLVAPI